MRSFRINIDHVVNNILLIALMFCSVFTLVPSLNKISLWVLMPIIAVISFIRTPSLFYRDRVLFCYFCLVLWIAFSNLFAYNSGLAWREMIRILSTFILTFIVCSLGRSEKNIRLLYFVYLLYFLSLIYYSFTAFNLQDIYMSGGRLDDESMNANTLAYFLFYASFSILLFQYRFNSAVYNTISYLLVLFLVVTISLLTASRQVIVIGLPLLFFFYVFKNIRLSFLNIFKILFLLFIAYLILLVLYHYFFAGSYLLERSEVGLEDEPRFRIIQKAVEVGLNHPLFGVGTGNFMLFSGGVIAHSTYFELFSCNGFPALILFCLLLYKSTIIHYRRYKITGNSIFMQYFLFSILFVLYNFLFVFINGIWLMPFLFLVKKDSDFHFHSFNMKY